jgi:glutamate synthase (NADPH/NADH) small chain
VKFAKNEGVELHLLTNPIEILGDDTGWVSGIKCIKMELGEPDESGRRRPVPIKDSEFVLDVDMVIMAIGSRADSTIKNTTEGLEVDRKNLIKIDEETGRTSKKHVYAGGDIVSGPATVILAMSAGKKAAKAIHKDLSGENKESMKK